MLAILLIFASFLIVHTLGHYLLAKGNNFEFFSLEVLGFEFKKIDKKINIAFQKDSPLPGRLIMLSNDATSLDNYIRYYMGGYLFEGIYLVLLIIIFASLNKPSYLISILVFYLIRYGYYLFNKDKLIRLSDYSYIKMYRERREALKSDNNEVLLELVRGTRPRDLALEDNELMKDIFKYYYYLDRRDFDKLYPYLKDLYIMADPDNKTNKLAIIYELIFYFSYVEKDKFKAYKYYKEVERELNADLDVNALRIRAYYEYYIQMNEKAALKFTNKALEVAPAYPITGIAKMETDLVKELKSEILKNRHKNRLYT